MRAFLTLHLTCCCLAASLLAITASARSNDTIMLPLSTRAERIIDAKGTPVVLRGVAWFGMETEMHVPHGLWACDYKLATKSPAPDQAAQEAAQRLIRDVFEKEFSTARTRTARRDLARRMITTAADTQNPSQRYVLLRVARDVAALAGDWELAFSAVERIDQQFEVDACQLRLRATQTVIRCELSAEENAALAVRLLDEAERSIGQQRFEQAEAWIAFARTPARQAGDVSLVAKTSRAAKDLEQAKLEHGQMALVREKLEKDPSDSEANLALGRYLCLRRGDWQAGVPHLALGSDPGLQRAARADLDGPTDPVQQAAVAGQWWQLAEASEGSARTQMQSRAASWYRKALPHLTGLTRVLAQRRLQEAPGGGTDLAAVGRRVPDPADTNPPDDKPPRERQSRQTPPHTRPPVPTSLAVLYRAEDRNPSDNQIKPHLNLVNRGSQPASLVGVTIRYWFSADGRQPLRCWCDWAKMGGHRIVPSFHRLEMPRSGADGYLEIGFSPDAPPVPPAGETGPIQLRFSKTDWANFDEANDYSFDPTKTDFALAPKITVYRQGKLIWGQEPK